MNNVESYLFNVLNFKIEKHELRFYALAKSRAKPQNQNRLQNQIHKNLGLEKCFLWFVVCGFGLAMTLY